MELLEGKTMRTLSQQIVSTKQEEIAELARREPKLVLTTLAHHIDVEWLHEAYRRTRKSGAVGVDGVTAAQYEANLDENLKSLLDRFKSGRYRAPPVRRVHIEKDGAGKKTRPIGIPTFEDKVLQRAVLMVLEPVYEQDFLGHLSRILCPARDFFCGQGRGGVLTRGELQGDWRSNSRMEWATFSKDRILSCVG
jgi:retron-type reverse transcriptase